VSEANTRQQQGVSEANTERERERGQAAVEFALTLPLAVMMLLAMVQVAVVTRDRMAVELAAREGARAAAVSADPSSAAHQAVDEVTSLSPLDVSVDTGADTVTVTVRYVSDTDVALIGAVVPSVAMSASVTMALEPPE